MSVTNIKKVSKTSCEKKYSNSIWTRFKEFEYLFWIYFKRTFFLAYGVGLLVKTKLNKH